MVLLEKLTEELLLNRLTADILHISKSAKLWLFCRARESSVDIPLVCERLPQTDIKDAFRCLWLTPLRASFTNHITLALTLTNNRAHSQTQIVLKWMQIWRAYLLMHSKIIYKVRLFKSIVILGSFQDFPYRANLINQLGCTVYTLYNVQCTMYTLYTVQTNCWKPVRLYCVHIQYS